MVAPALRDMTAITNQIRLSAEFRDVNGELWRSEIGSVIQPLNALSHNREADPTIAVGEWGVYAPPPVEPVPNCTPG
jgi:hypothetical protein